MIVRARFQAIITDNGSVYEIAEDGMLAYGVGCDNAGRPCWTTFDSLEMAQAYKNIMDQIEEEAA